MLFFRKNVMAFTGLFLCVFLVVHLGGNLILLLPPHISHDLYNIYSHKLGENIFIKVVSIALYLSIIVHTIYAVLVTKRNNFSKGQKYYVNHATESSSWTSQNMGLLGFIILIFIVVHMANFWARIKLGFGDSVPLDSNGLKDVYIVTTSLFKNPLYVLFYSVLMVPLAMHINHGFSSAFKTLGLYNLKYIKRVSFIGKIFSTAVLVGFGIIPIIVYLRSL
ncbi:fumarate reductase transmembrane cytochrome b subunit [Halobacteriovorax marinus SJ]|uniref:Fumarate reductase transmembrane cytochrome b subunit n=1 Tax=Halobacteriovorax marinus (strain ATCC BAA-682 / DSM 15412 / SJ) TaxID=862908 RepID=E1X4F6_HALMS|nr:succinate dehydrogenase cytochrome b subunit [Halobacteriovorax marinus]CBW25386.1 fumarate reductase transmembrane cytochrome b subunit [Halobacteriovorax marinus SJ]